MTPRRRAGSILTTVLVVVAACGQPPTAAVYLPRLLPVGGPTKSMTALYSGQLRIEDGCVWLRVDGIRHLVIWPAGTVASASAGSVVISDATGHERGRIGETVTLAGGEWPNDATAQVEALIGGVIPAACRDSDYWIGGLVEPPVVR